MRAFVLINVEPGSEENVLSRLKTLDYVEEAYVTYGTYDLVVQIQGETEESLKDAMHKIRTTEQVQSTLTLMLLGQ